LPKSAARHAVLSRMPKSMILRESVSIDNVCKMHRYTNCGVVLNPKGKTQEERGRRGCCLNDAQIVYMLIYDEEITDAEAVARGLWLPKKRDVRERILADVKVQRSKEERKLA